MNLVHALVLIALGSPLALSTRSTGKSRESVSSSRVLPRAALLPLPSLPAAPETPLPMLPRIARVRVEAAADYVVVVEDIALPRGEWRSGAIEVYAAFGAPGTPRAVDAHLLRPAAETDSRTNARTDLVGDVAGEAIAIEPVARRSPGAQVVLGSPQMAGVALRVRETALARVYATTDVAILRLRSLLPSPSRDASGARAVVVRLGTSSGAPLTLGRIQVVAADPGVAIAHAEAGLCGPQADRIPLAVTLLPKAAGRPGWAHPTIAPELAVRHASDDLCVHYTASL